MDSITVHTAKDLVADSRITQKRKYTSKACESCRKLKIRCRERKTNSGLPSCMHCYKIQTQCLWPEADGRKCRRAKSSSYCPVSPNTTKQSGQVSQLYATAHVHPLEGQPMDVSATRESPQYQSFYPPACSPVSASPHTVLQYYRYLGPTAIAPGYKKISLKIKNDNDISDNQQGPRGDLDEQSGSDVFDPRSSLPRAELLPHLLDAFFEYYGSYFCFLNRRRLENLIAGDDISTFLLCSIAALSARFCDPDVFKPYFSPLPAAQKREHWHYSLPFLAQAKTLLMPLLSIPSRDLVAGLLFLALAEFGDNNEAGMWMFTGMSTRVAQELGLHRKNPSIYTDNGRTPIDDAISNISDTAGSVQAHTPVDIQEFENSSQLILWWCVFVQDTSLANGTGRVPSIKRSEISVPLPTENDLANVRAGPGCLRSTSEANVFPHMVRLMLEYSRSVEFLNTSHQEVNELTVLDQSLDTVETIRARILTTYETIPEVLTCGAKQYRFASESGQAIPYLLLHLNYHLQVTFLAQACHAGEHEFPRSNSQRQNYSDQDAGRATSDYDCASLWKEENDLYRKAIRSIVHMLTIARFVDARPILSIFWLNQAFFHAACAYAGDMLRFQGHSSQQFYPAEEEHAFPIPSRFSTSVVVNMDEMGESSPSTTATDAYLALLAKTNYQFLRQAVKDMASYYAGAGWVDAVFDQRESGVRDVDLSIVSESISTYIRLHDLRRGSPPSSKADLPQQTSESAFLPIDDMLFSQDVLSGDFSEFDSQAFFNDYIVTDPNDEL